MNRQLELYVNAMIPEQYNVCGITLLPLSLGHIFLMKRFDCGFGSDDATTMGGIDDLILGVAICSRTYEDFLSFISDRKEFNKWCKMWGKEIKKACKKKQVNLLYELINFKEYMREGIVTPKYWENHKDDEGGRSGSHWTQSVYNVAISELGYSSSEALNAPVAKLLAEYYKHLERNGIITLMSDSDMYLIEESEKKEKVNE